MVRFGDNRHKHSTSHAVTTQMLCLHLAAGAVVICAAIVKAASGKEAAP